MSKPGTLPRPPQVTMLGWMILVGSVFVVMNVFDLLSGLRSLETREMVEDYLTQSPGDQLGWSVETGLSALRITAMVTAACAAAATVLGWFVLQRHHAARVGLSVVAVPLFVTGVLTGGFISSLVAAAIVLLWMQPSRDWFNGITPKSAPPLGREDGARNVFARSEDESAPPRVKVTTGAPSDPDGARPVDGFGDRPSGTPPAPEPGESAPTNPTQPYGHAPGQPYGTPGGEPEAPGAPYAQAPYAQAPYAPQPYAPPTAPSKRPGRLLAAAILTWIFAGFALISALATSALLAFAPGQMEPELERAIADFEQSGGQEVTTDMLMTTTIVMGVLMAVFCFVACLAALLMLGRRPQAAMTLAITASFTAFFCLVGGLLAASPLLLVPGAAAVMVVVLLRRGDVRAWLAGH